MGILHFKEIIKISGVNPYVVVDAELAKKLKPNWKKPMPVIVQVNGKPKRPWKINMMPVGDGNFYLYLNGIVRKASQTQVGDEVWVDLSFDKGYKSGPAQMPDWLKNALEKNPKALENYEKLSPSRQKEIVRYLTNLKSEEARNKNLEKTIQVLSGEEVQFMGRSWKDGV